MSDQILKDLQDKYRIMTIDEIKKLVCDSGENLLATGYVSGTWGNISFRIDDTFMAITPSGREYETMIADEIVIVNYKDHSYEGSIKPSSEFKLHTEIYRTRKNINAVITHPPDECVYCGCCQARSTTNFGRYGTDYRTIYSMC